MPVSYINKELVEEISLLEPFGKGNTKPIFAQKGLRVLSSRILGKNRNVAKLQLSDGAGCVVEAVYFGEADEFVDRIKTVEVWRSHIILRSTVIREEKLYRS